MYVLTSVARDDMNIEVGFHYTHSGAHKAMIDDIKAILGDDFYDNLYESEGEFVDDNGACIQTHTLGTICYRIDEVPERI